MSICTLSLIPKLFLFDEDELPAELRAQRRINASRIPDIAGYIIDNPGSYVFSALTASIDGRLDFRPSPSSDPDSDIGHLHVPMAANFVINDGQHRRAAIEKALKENPNLGEETIAVVFFEDPGLKRSQQMFADLNRYAVKPSKSLGVLYDHRDEMSEIARGLAFKSNAFKDLVDLEKTNLSLRSGKLFTLSSIYSSTEELLKGSSLSNPFEVACRFWNVVGEQFPQWTMVRNHEITAGEVRQNYIHTHSVVLHAIGVLGNALLARDYQDWENRLSILRDVDWSRRNTDVWEGRVMDGGRIVKSKKNILLTACYLKRLMGLEYTQKEKEVLLKNREAYE